MTSSVLLNLETQKALHIVKIQQVLQSKPLDLDIWPCHSAPSSVFWICMSTVAGDCHSFSLTSCFETSWSEPDSALPGPWILTIGSVSVTVSLVLESAIGVILITPWTSGIWLVLSLCLSGFWTLGQCFEDWIFGSCFWICLYLLDIVVGNEKDWEYSGTCSVWLCLCMLLCLHRVYSQCLAVWRTPTQGAAILPARSTLPLCLLLAILIQTNSPSPWGHVTLSTLTEAF